MVFPESVNAAGNGATLDLNNGLMYVFGEGGVSSHGIQTMNWHNFAPRVGVAYQLDPKTVIRAGYGWSLRPGSFRFDLRPQRDPEPAGALEPERSAAQRLYRRVHAGSRAVHSRARRRQL